MADELRLFLNEEGTDPEFLDGLTGNLRRELLQLDVLDVHPLPAGEAPPGTRGVDIQSVGALLVGLSETGGVLRSVVAAVRQWMARGHDGARSVRMEIGGDVLEISEVDAADRDRLIELFIARHATADATG
ncbi:hypothetical protein ACWEQL_01760 [Kitasatospora sp. NPDC004240]